MVDFSSQQINVFKKLYNYPPVSTGRGMPEQFLLQFVLFESLIRLVGHYYRERNSQKKKSDVHVSLDISVIKRSLLHFHIHVDDDRLGLLLDSKLTKRNTKSARNLRNGLAYQWKSEDVKEVKERYVEFDNALIGVVNSIKARVYSAGK